MVASLWLEAGQLTAAALVAIALAHGLAIAVLVASTSAISGGHVNPAVTLAMMATGKISIVRGVMYIIGQLVGAIAGSGLLYATVWARPVLCMTWWKTALLTNPFFPAIRCRRRCASRWARTR